MKPTAYIINTSRGPIIDEAALLAALREKKIAGAGLDVFDVEPLPTDHPLRKMDNVVLTPHLGYVATQNYRAYFAGVVDDIRGLPRRQAGARDGLIFSSITHDPNMLRGPPKASPEGCNQIPSKLRPGAGAYRAMADGGGSERRRNDRLTTRQAPPGADRLGAAEAAVAGGLPGSTTTRVPTLTRV